MFSLQTEEYHIRFSSHFRNLTGGRFSHSFSKKKSLNKQTLEDLKERLNKLLRRIWD
jgi:hypothetical protein